MAIVFVGASCVGICLLLSEILYPEIDNLLRLPVAYKIFLSFSFAVAAGGIVGCLFTKNRRNTTELECNIELALFFGGLACEIVCALIATDSRVPDLFICIGGAISSVGFFCGVGSFIGRIKRPKGVYADFYRGLIKSGKMKHMPKTGPASLLEIIEAEKYFGTMLPTELVEFLIEFNGDGELLFSTYEIADIARAMRETAFDRADKFCFFGADGYGDEAGLFCYQISNGSIKDGEIYLWDCKTNETKLVAAGLPELMDKYYCGKDRPKIDA